MSDTHPAVTIAPPPDLCDDTLAPGDEALARDVISRVADAWSLWVMAELAREERLRFSRLRERVEGVSQKMLTKTLRQLERDGLVARTVHAEVPPRVEYALTPLGREMVDRVAPLWTWAVARVPEVRAARARFDAPRR